MIYIVLEIPNHTFAPVGATSPLEDYPNIGALRDWADDVKNLRVAPQTFNGEFDHVVTTYEKLEQLAQFRATYTDNSIPDYISMIQFLFGLGCKLLPDFKFKRGKGYFAFDVFIKVSLTQYTSAKMPIGTYQYEGTGLEGDALEGERRTWGQYNVFVNGDNFMHQNDTHRFLRYNANTHEEFHTLLNHISTVNDQTKFDVLSLKELNEQIVIDQLEI